MAASPAIVAPIVIAARHPEADPIAVNTGKKSSSPADVLAPNKPVTNPRRSTNQRLATVAESTLAIKPAARPDTRPNQRQSAHRLSTVDDIQYVAAEPRRLAVVTRRMP